MSNRVSAAVIAKAGAGSLGRQLGWGGMTMACAAFLAVLVLPAASAGAAEVTTDQIVRALAPKKPLTRGLSVGAPAEAPAANAADSKFLDTLRGRTTRSLSTGEREQVATIASSRPAIDLEITFDYDSANVSSSAQPTVRALGEALTSGDLKGNTFLLAGHTDAAGSDAYNQALSERRADAIKAILVAKYGVAGSDLVTVGYGESRLKFPNTPMAAANRRVQIVNMTNQATASR